LAERGWKKTLERIWSRWALLRALAVGGMVGLLVAVMTYQIAPGFFQGIENNLYDARVRSALETTPPLDPDESGIVVITIDNRSIAPKYLGRFSEWPREYHARVARQLADWGAAAVFNDLIFAEDTRRPETDLELATAFGEAGIVYNAIDLIDLSNMMYRSTVDDEEIGRNAPLSFLQVKDVPGAERLPDFKTVKVLEAPSEIVQRASLALGLVNVVSDPDGVIRRLPLLYRYGDALFPAIGFRMFLDLVGINLSEIRVEPGRAITAGPFTFPVDSECRYLLRWYPDQAESIFEETSLGPFRQISYYDVLEGRVPSEYFAGTVCLIGPTAPGLEDLKATASSPALPGVMIHATLLTNLARRETVAHMNDGQAMLLVFLLAVLAAWLALRFRISVGSAANVALLLVFVVLSVWAYAQFALWLELFRPAVGLVLGFTAAMTFRYMTEERQKRVIKGAFQQYVSRDVVDEMLQDPDKLKLGGERKELTILFADIQGFTSFSEKLAPEELVKFLNRFLTIMSNVIFEHHGTVDKYIGDAIMAIFGAPLPLPDHAARGVRAALGMRRQIDGVRQEYGGFLPETFDMKLGLNTGPMVVGNMGSDIRFDYTVLGDNVNLASRVEALTRQYGVGLLVTEATLAALDGESFLAREIDRVRVKGKAKPVSVYEVLAEAGTPEDTSELRARLAAFTEGLTAYRAQEWDRAEAAFQGLGNDPAATVFSERCRLLREHPPGPDWDGVWVMKTK
jgi:adenylate cyclase